MVQTSLKNFLSLAAYMSRSPVFPQKGQKSERLIKTPESVQSQSKPIFVLGANTLLAGGMGALLGHIVFDMSLKQGAVVGISSLLIKSLFAGQFLQDTTASRLYLADLAGNFGASLVISFAHNNLPFRTLLIYTTAMNQFSKWAEGLFYHLTNKRYHL